MLTVSPTSVASLRSLLIVHFVHLTRYSFVPRSDTKKPFRRSAEAPSSDSCRVGQGHTGGRWANRVPRGWPVRSDTRNDRGGSPGQIRRRREGAQNPGTRLVARPRLCLFDVVRSVTSQGVCWMIPVKTRSSTTTAAMPAVTSGRTASTTQAPLRNQSLQRLSRSSSRCLRWHR